MHSVVIVALDNVIAFDLSTPLEVFGRARGRDGLPVYETLVCAASPEVSAGPFRIRAHHGLEALRDADTVIMPGRLDAFADLPVATSAALRAAAARGARIASICVGAVALAQAGLLDGRRATTHWVIADELARRFPQVKVDPAVLFIDDGDILTSAGAAAGLDLCLHMVSSDNGAAVAADTARLAVMPLMREGGQAQYIPDQPLPTDEVSLAPVLEWMQTQLDRPLPVTAIAEHAHLSVRTLARRFRQQTGTTPANWLQAARMRRARSLLETTSHSIDQIATRSGFSSTVHFRTAFRKAVGSPPGQYRRAFGATPVRSPDSAAPSVTAGPASAQATSLSAPPSGS
ncbi:GlxA family transcriptional regulator [uncultured Friedmanniella sp.]|uniref:GlxA family transcriptional regulator n=1 Tax=uncultured Friedmanniella sp. TaxID=335381 RepID=UPI0035CB9FC5